MPSLVCENQWCYLIGEVSDLSRFGRISVGFYNLQSTFHILFYLILMATLRGTSQVYFKHKLVHCL